MNKIMKQNFTHPEMSPLQNSEPQSDNTAIPLAKFSLTRLPFNFFPYLPHLSEYHQFAVNNQHHKWIHSSIHSSIQNSHLTVTQSVVSAAKGTVLSTGDLAKSKRDRMLVHL